MYFKVLLYNLKWLFLSSDAKVNVRDYHGKMAAHYWNGSKDLFTEHRPHSGTYNSSYNFLFNVSNLQIYVYNND